MSKGERWDAIAYKMYGDSTQIEPLIQNNPGIPIGDIVAQGVQVFVPLITPSTSTTSSARRGVDKWQSCTRSQRITTGSSAPGALTRTPFQ